MSTTMGPMHAAPTASPDAGHHAGHGTPHHGHAEHEGAHSSLSGYVVGFLLSAVLTAIPFGLVMSGLIDERGTAVLVLGAFAVVQIAVHLICFLHVTPKLEGGWTLLSTVLTAVFVIIGLAGTLWIIMQMNSKMMPGHEEHEAAAAERAAAQRAAPAAPPLPAAPQSGYGGARTN